MSAGVVWNLEERMGLIAHARLHAVRLGGGKRTGGMVLPSTMKCVLVALAGVMGRESRVAARVDDLAPRAGMGTGGVYQCLHALREMGLVSWEGGFMRADATLGALPSGVRVFTIDWAALAGRALPAARVYEPAAVDPLGLAHPRARAGDVALREELVDRHGLDGWADRAGATLRFSRLTAGKRRELVRRMRGAGLSLTRICQATGIAGAAVQRVLVKEASGKAGMQCGRASPPIPPVKAKGVKAESRSCLAPQGRVVAA